MLLLTRWVDLQTSIHFLVVEQRVARPLASSAPPASGGRGSRGTVRMDASQHFHLLQCNHITQRTHEYTRTRTAYSQVTRGGASIRHIRIYARALANFWTQLQ